MCQRVHSAVCTRPAANRTRLAGHERPLFRPWTDPYISVNPLPRRGNYNATSNNVTLIHWPLMGGLLRLVQRGEDWAGPQLAQALLAVPNVTAHPSTASVPITVLLYNGSVALRF